MHEPTTHTRRRPRWTRRILSLIAVVAAAAVPISTPAPAAADRAAVTFRHVEVDGHRVSITYAINRRPSHVTGRTCYLDDGDRRLEVRCGRLPSADTRPTRVRVVLRGLAYGDYTFTVRSTHKRSLLAKGTTGPFNVGGLELDQANVGVDGTSGAVGATCEGVDGADRAQTFTAGRDGQLRAVSVIVLEQGDAPDLLVRITGVAAGAPDDTVLGSGTYSGRGSSDTSRFVDIPLSSPADLTEGEQYALVLTMEPGGDCSADLLWAVIGGGDDYGAGSWLYQWSGEPWGDTGQDQAFKTWMAP